ncbi:phage protease [Pacificibacter sp. AS14]|uniref:phage protease n=1 Tax=Pacificibacter sp. AS14 TaxID=3135785 RepID=UPI003179C109
MNTPNHITALMAAQTIAPAQAGDAPEWIHLLPGGAQVETGDRRGPYHINDAQAIIDASFAGETRLAVDENHSIDLAAPKGGASPARGWITEMQARDDGIWGKVEWTDAGRDLVATHAYRGISPVITHSKTKAVLSILRASLVNQPNLKGLASLNSQQQETDMNFMQQMAQKLGLGADASEGDIFAAADGLKSDDTSTALQSQMSEIGTVLGVDGGDSTAILAAAKAAKSTGSDELVALQATITELGKTVTSLQSSNTTNKATAFVDEAIKAKRVGVKPQRDVFIAMHAENPERTEALINALPALGPSGMSDLPPAADKDGKIALNAQQRDVADVLGLSHDDFAKSLASDPNQEAL